MTVRTFLDSFRFLPGVDRLLGRFSLAATEQPVEVLSGGHDQFLGFDPKLPPGHPGGPPKRPGDEAGAGVHIN